MAKYATRRSSSYHFRQFEIGGFILGLLILGILFGAMALEAPFSPLLGGYGGAVAFSLGFILFVYLYGVSNRIGRYDAQIGLGLFGGILFWFLNLPQIVPFGQAIVNLWAYNVFAGKIAAFIFVISMLILLFEAFGNTKRDDIV